MDEQILGAFDEIDATRSIIAKFHYDHDLLVAFLTKVESDLSTCLEPQFVPRHVLEAIMLRQDYDERNLSFVRGRRLMLQKLCIVIKGTVTKR
jgi:hypothetical protein